MLNFDSLPTQRPNAILPAGKYKAVIATAEMKQPNDPNKPKYLNLRLDLFDDVKGSKLGSVFDIITESSAGLARYKLGRFLTALNLKLTNFELSDLVKIVPNKSMFVDIKIESSEQFGDRNVVDAMSNEIYYPYTAPEPSFNDMVPGADDDLPFDASDSAESETTDNSEEY